MAPAEATTDPANHAGHHTSQITTCVHKPWICHPRFAAVRISVTLVLVAQVAIKVNVKGLSTASKSTTPAQTILWLTPTEDEWEELLPGSLGIQRCTKERGTVSRPTKNAREKLRVARADRNIPSSNREKHETSVRSWRVGGRMLARRSEATCGRRKATIVEKTKVPERDYQIIVSLRSNMKPKEIGS